MFYTEDGYMIDRELSGILRSKARLTTENKTNQELLMYRKALIDKEVQSALSYRKKKDYRVSPDDVLQLYKQFLGTWCQEYEEITGTKVSTPLPNYNEVIATYERKIKEREDAERLERRNKYGATLYNSRLSDDNAAIRDVIGSKRYNNRNSFHESLNSMVNALIEGDVATARTRLSEYVLTKAQSLLNEDFDTVNSVHEFILKGKELRDNGFSIEVDYDSDLAILYDNKHNAVYSTGSDEIEYALDAAKASSQDDKSLALLGYVYMLSQDMIEPFSGFAYKNDDKHARRNLKRDQVISDAKEHVQKLLKTFTDDYTWKTQRNKKINDREVTKDITLSQLNAEKMKKYLNILNSTHIDDNDLSEIIDFLHDQGLGSSLE